MDKQATLWWIERANTAHSCCKCNSLQKIRPNVSTNFTKGFKLSFSILQFPKLYFCGYYFYFSPCSFLIKNAQNNGQKILYSQNYIMCANRSLVIVLVLAVNFKGNPYLILSYSIWDILYLRMCLFGMREFKKKYAFSINIFFDCY